MENKKSRVVIMGCESYDNELVYEKLKAAVDLLGGIGRFVNEQERILLKPNLLRGKNPDAGITTHPAVFEAMIRILLEADCSRLAYGDSPGFGAPAGAAKESGLANIAANYEIPLKEFSSGQQIVANIALKPTSSITVPGHTINRFGEEVEMITKGRHDPCVGIRAVPIAEAMLAIVLMDHFMRQRAQNGDVTTTIPRW